MSLKSILERRDIPSEVKEAITNELAEFKRTKARLEYLLKSGPAIIYACEPWGDYQTKFMSENVKDILGYDPEKFFYNHPFWVDGIHPEDKQRVTKSFSKILDTNFFSEAYRFQQKDGTYRWMLEEANLIRDEQGNPLEIVGFWTDITRQKEAEEHLRRERENLYRILNSTDDVIYIINTQHEIEFINSAGENEFGPVEGKKCFEYFNDFSEGCPWCTAEKVIDGQIIRREKTLPKNQKTYDMIDTPFRNLDGSVSSLAILRDITDRKKIEEALKESEENFRELVDLLPTTVFEIDPSGDFLFSNRHGLEISGYTQEDLDQGLNALQLFVPEDRPMVKENILKILEGEKVEGHEYTALKKDGSTFPVLTYSTPVYRDKRPVKLRGIVVDITQLKETEKALRKSEEKYRTFVENFQGIAFKGYEDFSAGFFHGKVEEITGYTEDDFISGKIVYNQLIHPEDIHWINEDVEKFMSSSQRATQREYRIIDKNGDILWIQESIQKFYNEKQKKGGVHGTLQDITERKRAEEALRESQELFNQFMDHLPAATFIKTKNSKTLFANKYLKDVFGGEEWIGKTPIELFPKDDTRKMIVDDQKALTEGLQVIMEELLDKHNVTRTYQTYKFPIKRINKENLLGGIAFDITVQKKTEEKLRESEQKFRTFIETLPEPVWIYQDYQCRYANPAAEQITGYSREELSSMKFWDFLHPDYKNMAIEGGKALEKDLSPPVTSAIAKIITKSGKERWLDTRLELIKFEDRRATLISAMDITERKQAEEALRESENKYRNLVERAQDGIVIVQG
ncbi:MAG: PAS domain-containing protein, partial [Candidatus Hodarchaeota archaeon]